MVTVNQNLENDHKETIKILYETIQDLKDRGRKQIQFIISEYLFRNVMLSLNNLFKEHPSKLEIVSSLRYLLEALIVSKLLCIEENYDEKLFNSELFLHLELEETILERLEKEYAFIHEYESYSKSIQDETNSLDFVMELERQGMDQEEIVKTLQEQTREQNTKLEDFLSQKVTMFVYNMQNNGAGYQKHLLETQIKPFYSKRLEGLKEDVDKLEKDLEKKDWIKKEQDRKTKEENKSVQNILVDRRTWSKKSRVTGFEDEYKFVYKLTSSLLHCTSFSIFGAGSIEQPYLVLFKQLALQYVYKIRIQIEEYQSICKE